MNIDIFPIESNYRGIDRNFSIDHLKLNKDFDEMLNIYFDYININMNLNNITSLNIEKNLYKFYKQFKFHGVKCELIAFDNNPINKSNFYFLGIDIVNEYFESILSNENYLQSKNFYLNNNGLFTNFKDAEKILEKIPNDEAGHRLKPYYVYKIKLVK